MARYDLSLAELSELMSTWGGPAYRAKQVWQGLYTERPVDPWGATALPKDLRARLEGEPSFASSLRLAHSSTSEHDTTIKWLWELHDGAQIETVLMHYPDRTTVCISSQAGCAMACGFCATGQAGFERNLTSGEIVEQVIRARAEAARTGRRLSNVVFMGMGEPMANYANVWRAVERMQGDIGISARHLTISTVGVVPGIRRLASESLPVNLAVSLHAANDELRNELVPINRTYPLDAIAAACELYVSAKHRRLSFEWALIDGVNDRGSDAHELAAYARPLGAHVNLIPLNPTPGYLAQGTPYRGVRSFADRLLALGINATVRRNRGTGIDAACGQLRATVGRQPAEGVTVAGPRRRVAPHDKTAPQDKTEPRDETAPQRETSPRRGTVTRGGTVTDGLTGASAVPNSMA